MRATAERGQNGRPSTDEVLDPQAAREAKIRAIFREQHKFLAALFVKDGPTMVARCLSSALMALKMRDSKSGAIMLDAISPEVIAEKCIACHHMGLEPVTEAYLVAYKTNLQIIPAPKGLIKLMANAGWRVEARAVREGDFFEHDLGDEGFIKHRKVDGRRDGAVTFGYAHARHKDGGPTIREVLSRDDIESYRAQSKQAEGPMWLNWYEGAVRKTLIHRISEFVPLPSEVRAVFRQNEAGGVEVPEEIMAAVRAKLAAAAAAEMAGPAPVVAEDERVHVPARMAAREPGEDG